MNPTTQNEIKMRFVDIEYTINEVFLNGERINRSIYNDRNLPSKAALRSIFAFIRLAADSNASIPAAPVQ